LTQNQQRRGFVRHKAAPETLFRPCTARTKFFFWYASPPKAIRWQ